MLFENMLRGCDKHGCGAFNAPRGDRHHRGLDIQCLKCQKVLSPVAGHVTKIGFCYSKKDKEKSRYRYIEIDFQTHLRIRILYVSPFVVEGQDILKGQFIGQQQGLGVVYKGIREHIHLELLENGKRIDPIRFFNEFCLT